MEGDDPYTLSLPIPTDQDPYISFNQASSLYNSRSNSFPTAPSNSSNSSRSQHPLSISTSSLNGYSPYSSSNFKTPEDTPQVSDNEDQDNDPTDPDYNEPSSSRATQSRSSSRSKRSSGMAPRRHHSASHDDPFPSPRSDAASPRRYSGVFPSAQELKEFFPADILEPMDDGDGGKVYKCRIPNCSRVCFPCYFIFL